MTEQEELFYNWKSECEKLKSLSGFIQNDFERMLADGTTKEEIKQAEIEYKKEYINTINNISSLESKIHILLKKYST